MQKTTIVAVTLSEGSRGLSRNIGQEGETIPFFDKERR